MIKISPKALRFARLAAEDNPLFAGDPQFFALLEKERRLNIAFADDGAERPRQIEISNETALFCLRALTSVVRMEKLARDPDWDGNDLEFADDLINVLSTDLSEQSSIQGFGA